MCGMVVDDMETKSMTEAFESRDEHVEGVEDEQPGEINYDEIGREDIDHEIASTPRYRPNAWARCQTRCLTAIFHELDDISRELSLAGHFEVEKSRSRLVAKVPPMALIEESTAESAPESPQDERGDGGMWKAPDPYQPPLDRGTDPPYGSDISPRLTSRHHNKPHHHSLEPCAAPHAEEANGGGQAAGSSS
ncbi:hypothetical protein CPLU01_02500 [Colletotrichum plurivorum]|uniref:Uncharacterized protein n=1 Tax=Colletotrichum plurivorum TaxID=2175906 RepID=A0A8H6KWE0_9PEZI|nr:hypothetical protein CPLU01_02500 [Colletotrichum plurivorum]